LQRVAAGGANRAAERADRRHGQAGGKLGATYPEIGLLRTVPGVGPIVAAARKLAVLLHSMWRSGQRFQPFPQAAVAA
jgi:hypothetical protein